MKYFYSSNNIFYLIQHEPLRVNIFYVALTIGSKQNFILIQAKCMLDLVGNTDL